MAAPTSVPITYVSGNEHDPGDPFGRCDLRVAADGSAELAVHRFGTARTWRGRVGAGTVAAVAAHLEAAGFPAQPEHDVPGGSSLRSLTVGEGKEAKAVLLAFHAAEAMPGYGEAFALLDAVIVALTGGSVPVVPAPVPVEVEVDTST
jgi:hypothetical protein